MKSLLRNATFCLFLLGGLAAPVRVMGQGTAFTYQGQLMSAGSPANGSFDLTFGAWNASAGGSRLAGPLTNAAVLVSNGLFTVTLDFGAGVFTGPARWLELGVRPAGSGAFTVLTPRQACTASPYAISAGNAATAATVTGNVAASQLTGTLLPGNIGAGTISAADLAPNAAAANLNAAGQSGVASSGLVLSAIDNNTNLVNAGYVKIYGSFGTPEAWQPFTNPPMARPPTPRDSHTALWTGTEMIIWGGYSGNYFNDGGRYNPAVDSWTALPVVAGSTPPGRLNHTAVWTGSAMLVWGGVGGTNYLNDGGLYDPILNAWTYVPNTIANTPSARLHHTAVWSGNAMVVWGGTSGAQVLNDGGLYNPGLNTWTYLPGALANTPAARAGHTAVWTGTEMIIWGGAGVPGSFNDGGRYNPSSNQWTSIPNSLAGTPVARQSHTAVWTGTEMIIWGGAGPVGDVKDGGRYNPTANAWIAIGSGLANAPVARESHTAVWSGTEMIVWGGFSDVSSGLVNDGGRYNPTSSTWIYVTNGLPNTPGARYQSTAVWSGTEMIVWGGAGPVSQLNDGGRYNPSLNSWIYLSGTILNSPPPARAGHTAVWTGSEMIAWGGANGSSFFNDGGRFNPAVNNWTYVPGTLANAPGARSAHTAVWTGTEMLIWGGVNGSGFLGDGGRYNPATNGWVYLAGGVTNSPAARDGHTSIWTGTNMIVWGGSGGAGLFNDGSLYNPVTKTWTYLAATLPNTPAPRASHTAVWTGTEMIVWGGASNTTTYADGGRYNPAGNAWIYLTNSLPNTPAARSAATVVWTGTEMLVWGGIGGGGALNDGGRYNPVLSAWTYVPATLPNAPTARSGHTAVWTGTAMIVWGGTANGNYDSDGGVYSPALNSWTAISGSLANAPASRAQHTAVWTGSTMLVWGGANGTVDFNDTTGYVPSRVLYLYQRP